MTNAQVALNAAAVTYTKWGTPDRVIEVAASYLAWLDAQDAEWPTPKT